MKGAPLSERDLRMLDLLGQGDSSKAIAKKLGYRPGTTRVYLHDLYRKIGVPNKTTAVIWYFDRIKKHSAPVEPEPAASQASPLLEESVGDLAMRTNLLTAMGAMSTLIGPYGRLWQVATRMKGGRVEKALIERRVRSRQFWEALLRGDFAHGKKVFDAGSAGAILLDSPGDGAQLAMLLLLGGYSNAADRMVTELGRKRRMPSGVTVKDHDLLLAVRSVVNKDDRAALARIQRISRDNTAPPARQAAIVALFHLGCANDDAKAACAAADALWQEAESCLKQLHAMGERPFRGSVAPAPETPVEKPTTGARRKDLVTVR